MPAFAPPGQLNTAQNPLFRPVFNGYPPPWMMGATFPAASAASDTSSPSASAEAAAPAPPLATRFHTMPDGYGASLGQARRLAKLQFPEGAFPAPYAAFNPVGRQKKLSEAWKRFTAFDVSMEDLMALLANGRLIPMTVITNVQRMLWLLPQWIDKMPFSLRHFDGEMRQLSAAAMASNEPTAEACAEDPVFVMPRLPSGAAVCLWLQYHFVVLALNRESSRPVPTIIDSMAATFWTAENKRLWLPRIQLQAEAAFGSDIGSVVVGRSNLFRQPMALVDHGALANMCGLYACAALVDIMLGGRTVREVLSTFYNPWRLRVWVLRCLCARFLTEPPRL